MVAPDVQQDAHVEDVVMVGPGPQHTTVEPPMTAPTPGNMTGGAEEPAPPTLKDDPGGNAEKDPGRGDQAEQVPGTAAMMTQHAEKELPRNMLEARQRPDAEQWESALDKELHQHMTRGVYEIVRASDIPKEANIVPMTEILTVKEAPDGTIERFKVRLCVRGDQEKWWARPTSTSSPVLSAETFRLLCAVVSTKPEWDWWQLDYTQAYTNAELPEDR